MPAQKEDKCPAYQETKRIYKRRPRYKPTPLTPPAPPPPHTHNNIQISAYLSTAKSAELWMATLKVLSYSVSYPLGANKNT